MNDHHHHIPSEEVFVPGEEAEINASELSTEEAGVFNLATDSRGEISSLFEDVEILGDEERLVAEVSQASGLPAEEVRALVENSHVREKLSQLHTKKSTFLHRLETLIPVIATMLLIPSEAPAQNRPSFEQSSVLMDRIQSKSQIGFQENYIVRVGGELKQLSYSSSNEWMVLLGRHGETTKFVASVEGGATGINVDAEKMVQAMERIGYGGRETEMFPIHNHSFGAWEGAMTSAEDQYAGFRKKYAMVDLSPEVLDEEVRAMQEGRIPTVYLPPSAPDVFDFFAEAIVAARGSSQFTPGVADSRGVWQYHLEEGIAKKGFGADVYHAKKSELQHTSLPQIFREKYEMKKDEYHRAHARITEPFSEAAFRAYLNGDKAPLERELAEKDEQIKKLIIIAREMGIVMTFTPYPEEEAAPGDLIAAKLPN